MPRCDAQKSAPMPFQQSPGQGIQVRRGQSAQKSRICCASAQNIREKRESLAAASPVLIIKRTKNSNHLNKQTHNIKPWAYGRTQTFQTVNVNVSICLVFMLGFLCVVLLMCEACALTWGCGLIAGTSLHVYDFSYLKKAKLLLKYLRKSSRSLWIGRKR